MSKEIALSGSKINIEAITKALMYNDLSKLNDDQKLEHYSAVCKSVGLNPITNPLQYIALNGKLVLYAGKNCTEQLRDHHNVSINITSREKIDDIYIVTAKATLPNGRVDESTGAVNVKGLVGDALANAFLRAETKAKRRVTLSLIGLGMMDESEVETIPGAIAPQSTPLPQKPQAKPRGRPPKEVSAKQVLETNPGDFMITFTKGFKGKKISDLSPENLEKLVLWCIKNNQFHEFQAAADAYLKQNNPEIPVPELEEVDDFPAFDNA